MCSGPTARGIGSALSMAGSVGAEDGVLCASVVHSMDAWTPPTPPPPVAVP